MTRYRDDYDDRSRRRYDDEDDDYDRPRRSERRGFRCPYCRSDEPPYYSSQIAAGGWVLFAVLLLFCLPLCFLGLLIREEHRVCRDCGIRLG